MIARIERALYGRPMPTLRAMYRRLDALHALAFGPAVLGLYWLAADQVGVFGYAGRLSNPMLAASVALTLIVSSMKAVFGFRHEFADAAMNAFLGFAALMAVPLLIGLVAASGLSLAFDSSIKPMQVAQMLLGSVFSVGWLLFAAAKCIDSTRKGVRSTTRSALLAVILVAPAGVATHAVAPLFAGVLIEAPFDPSDR